MPTPEARRRRTDKANYRRLVWFRWTLGVAACVVVTVVISSYYQRDSLVSGCKRNSSRAALTANGFRQLSDRVAARGALGDKESAMKYGASATALIAAIPGYDGTDAIADSKIVQHDGRTEYVLTSSAQRMQNAGCSGAFPTPIPFVE